MRVLVIDNIDSFVHNIVQYLAQLGAEVEVWRKDDPRLTPLTHDGAASDPLAGFDGVLLSPGPGTPEQAEACLRILRQSRGERPIFGVCLGLQAMAVAFGGRVDRAPELRHGKTSEVFHEGRGVFAGLTNPVTATRYHSLAIVEGSLPDDIEVTARTGNGIIMGIRHRTLPIEAVQFHPESVLTQGGHRMLATWLAECGDADAPARAEVLEAQPLVRGLSAARGPRA